MLAHDSERTETGELVVAFLGTNLYRDNDELAEALRSIPQVGQVAVHNAAYDLGHLPAYAGEHLRSGIVDTMMLSWLLDSRPPHGLKPLALRDLGESLEDPIYVGTDGIVRWRQGGPPIVHAPEAEVARYCAADTKATAKLADLYLSKLSRRMRKWYWDIEEPHLRSVIASRRVGLPIDVEGIPGAIREAEDHQAEALADLHNFAGWAINPESSDQVSGWLYGDVVERKEKVDEGFYSTGRPRVRWRLVEYAGLGLRPPRDALRRGLTTAGILEEVGPAGEKILAVRDWNKILNSYLRPMATLVDKSPDQRIRCSYNLAGTETGRPSVSKPNLQSLPSRKSSGALVRGLVCAPPGKVLVMADYSQLEFRIVIHLAGADPIEGDVHQALADRAGISRTAAKSAFYGQLYGAGVTKTAMQLGVSIKEAKVIRSALADASPEISRWKDGVIRYAQENGCVEMPSGRVRWLPDARGNPSPAQAGALRQAVNTVAQGAASDVLKSAVVALWYKGIVPVLQVHDQLILEVDEVDAEDAARTLTECMENAGPAAGMDTVLPIDLNISRRWEKKGTS